MRKLSLVLVFVTLLNGCSLTFWRQAPGPAIDSETIALIQQYTSQAQDAVKSGELKRAEELYKRAIVLNPNSAVLHAKLAGVYVAQDEIEKAIDEFERAIVLDPGNLSNRNYLGYLYEKLGFYQRAAEEYESVLEIDPKNLYALIHLGLAYRQLNRLSEAEVILETAVELDPECKNPDSKNLYNYLGLVYQDKGEYDKAIKAYKKSIQLFPDDVWAHNQLGSLYEKLGMLYEAQTEYLETLKYDPHNAFALSRLNAVQQAVIAGRINIQPVEISQDDIEAILKRSQSAKDYPEADAVILLNKISQEVSKDGILRFTIYRIVKILSWRGVRSYGQIAIPFNRRYQNIGVNIARTYLPDGTVLEPSDDAFTDITPPGLIEFNLFSDMMWKVITMPGVSPGAVIEYQATIEDIRSRLVESRIWFWGGMSFQGYDPTLRSKYVLKVPKDQEISWKAYNCDLKPRIREDGDFTIYIWEYGETPALKDEPGMPPLEELIPRFSFSSVKGWDEVAKWFNDLIADKRKASPEVKQKVEELTTGLKELDDKIKAIYDFVASEIRYIGLELGEGTYQPHSAGSVLENGYGDCKDKVMLMLAMLEQVGVKAYPVMISPRPAPDADKLLPSPGQFSHLIVAIPQADGGYLWLDPTSETCTFGDLPFADQGRKGLVIKEDGRWEFAKTPVFPAECNTLSIESSIRLMPDGGIKGEERISAKGQQGMIYRLAYRYVPEHRLKEFLQMDLVRRYVGVKVDKVKTTDPYDMRDPFELLISFTVPHYPIQVENSFILMIPGHGFSDMATMVAKEDRRYNLNLGYPAVYEKKVKIILPSGFEFEGFPDRVVVRNDLGRFERWIEQIDGGMIYRMRFKLERSVVTPKDYPKAKKLLEILAREDKMSVVIRRIGGREKSASACWEVAEEEKLFQFASSLFDEEEYQAALAEYKRLLFLYPAGDRTDDARFRIGACYQNMGMYHSAIAAYEAYLTEYPNSPLRERVKLNIAECYLLAHHRNEAKKRFEMLISSPDGEVAIRSRFLLGLMEVEGENWVEAAKWFRSIMKLYPKSDQALLAGQMYDLAQRGTAIKKRSIAKAALLSALLPGAGQIYGGNLSRGLKILAVFGLSAISEIQYIKEDRSILAVPIALLTGAVYLWNIKDAMQVTKEFNLLSRSLLIKRMRDQIEKEGF